MIEKQWKKFEWLGLISLFLTLISFATMFAINFRLLYVWDIHALHILDYTTLGDKALLENFDQLMQFLNNPFAQTLSLPDFPMSASGIQHFIDVKHLFLLDYVVLLLTIIPSVYYLRHLNRTARFWKLVRPFQIAMGVPVVFGFFMLMGFDQFFITFHETFFTNSDWLFDPRTDPIINVLPEAFFMHSFILFFVLIEALFFGMVLLGKWSLRPKKETGT